MIRFVATTLLLVAARALDALTTWIATRDLTLESNPLARVLHLGWRGLLVVNLLAVGVLTLAAWRAAFVPPPLPPERGLDFEGFIARYWFGARGRRTVSQAVMYLPADRRVRWAFIGGPGAAIVIGASTVLAAWNLLVARGIIVHPMLGRVWLVAFWGAVAMSLALSVRAFLRRAYDAYARHAR
jgi:hypothetical protein